MALALALAVCALPAPHTLPHPARGRPDSAAGTVPLEAGRTAGREPRRARATAVHTSLAAVQTHGNVDFVVVGGGTAGCVLANRLSADPSKHVVMLEPGPSPVGSVKVAAPVALTKLFHSSWDWKFASDPTRATAGRAVHLARGRALGGSSAFNALLYHRGSAQDFDEWGLPGWSSEHWLAAFCAVERQRRPELAKSVYHGTDGPVSVEDARYENPLSSAFVQASLQAGMKENPDFNDWSTDQAGVGRFQLQTRRGRRAHAAATHLRPALRRRNLQVRSGCSVTRVILNESGEATGVEFVDKHGNKQIIDVSGGEVIMCAGAISTPHLLMLSGIGPRAELEKHGIPVLFDVPGVGANLADHPAVANGYSIRERMSITDEMFIAKGILSPARLLQWLVRGSGPLSTTGCDFGGFVRTDTSKALPDLQLRFVPGLGTSPDGVSSYRDIGRSGQLRSGVTFQSVGIRPQARGSIRLRSRDPFEPPLVEPGFASSSADVKTLREGIRLARKIASQPAFKDIIVTEEWPGAGLQTDEELDEYISRTLHSANAIAGSCKMGVPEDPMAVVDLELRVRGTTNLRVVDASVFPTMPGGQLGASTFALAERASSIILGGAETTTPSSGLA